MSEQQNQDKKLEGGLPFLEWVLSHQGWFLIICLPLSFIATSVVVVGVIALIAEYYLGKSFSGVLNSFAEIPVFSLALVVASVTFAVTIWRGYQAYEQIRRAREQIDEAQKQSRLTRFQNAVEMATQKENPARCISGLRALESMHKDLDDTDRETVYSVALYVLAMNKEASAQRVSRTVRQWALDILVDKGFLSQESLVSRLRDREGSIEMSVRETMIGKDLSLLYFARQSRERDLAGNKILDLSNFSFRNCDFYGANLSGVILRNADLKLTYLYGTNLSRADLTGANLFSIAFAYYYSGQPTIDFTDSVKTWDDWKAFIRKAGREVTEDDEDRFRHSGHRVDSEAWYYMLRIAAEDAPCPPGVVGGDEREESEGE